MNKALKMAAGLAFVVGSQAALADVLVDDFSVAQSVTAGAAAIAGNTVGGAAACANILGCYRDIVIDNTFGTGTASADIIFNNTNPNLPPAFELTTATNNSSRTLFTITWDGDPTSGNLGNSLGGNFSGLSGFQFLVSSDGGLLGTKLVKVEMVDINGKKSTYTFPAENTGLIPGNVDGYVQTLFGFGPDFIEQAGFDYSQIASLQAVINVDFSTVPDNLGNGGTRGLDFAIQAVTVVPEPGTLALAGLVLTGLGAARARRKVAKA